MQHTVFSDFATVRHEGEASESPLAYRYYDANRIVIKVRRQSFEPADLIHAHVGAVDLCAHAFLLAARIFEEGSYEKLVAERYADWREP